MERESAPGSEIKQETACRSQRPSINKSAQRTVLRNAHAARHARRTTEQEPRAHSGGGTYLAAWRQKENTCKQHVMQSGVKLRGKVGGG